MFILAHKALKLTLNIRNAPKGGRSHSTRCNYIAFLSKHALVGCVWALRCCIVTCLTWRFKFVMLKVKCLLEKSCFSHHYTTCFSTDKHVLCEWPIKAPIYFKQISNNVEVLCNFKQNQAKINVWSFKKILAKNTFQKRLFPLVNTFKLPLTNGD